MARIESADPAEVDPYAKKVLEAQSRTWGSPLANHLVYARRPALFRAVRGMWTSLDKEGLIGESLISLVNRRVAMLNGCVF